MAKKKKKQYTKQYYKEKLSNITVGVVIILMLLLALVHYDQENSKNTYNETGKIYNVERINAKNRRWIMFCMNGEDYYYTLSATDHEVVLSEFLQAEQQCQKVTLSITDELEFHHLLHTGLRKKVVAIYCDKGINISMEAHNHDQRFRQALWIVIAFFVFATYVFYKSILFLLGKKRKSKKRDGSLS